MLESIRSNLSHELKRVRRKVLVSGSPQSVLPRHEAFPKAAVDVIAAEEGNEDVEEVHGDDGECSGGDLFQDLLLEPEQLAFASWQGCTRIASLRESRLVCLTDDDVKGHGRLANV